MKLVLIWFYIVTFFWRYYAICTRPLNDENAQEHYNSNDGESIKDSTIIVDTSLGKVLGSKQGAVNSYLGIPYAEPPLGRFRFRPPRPKRPWYPSVYRAINFAPECLQSALYTSEEDISRPKDEDCLYLNIWQPARINYQGARKKTKKSQRMNSKADDWEESYPVMIWVYGGAFLHGGASRPEYYGDRLAARGVILVSINYRMGALGFLVSTADGLYGNYGLGDQKTAIQWVHDNIHAFGGDPKRVTLFGESAGAMSIGLHLLDQQRLLERRRRKRNAYRSQRFRDGGGADYLLASAYATNPTAGDDQNEGKLFHAVILQSNPLGYKYRSIAVANFIGASYKEQLDCEDLRCLQSESAEEIIHVQDTLMAVPRSIGDFFTWGPVVTDQSFYREARLRPGPLANVTVRQPMDAMRELRKLDVPVIIGTTAHEGTVFVFTAYPTRMTKIIYQALVFSLFRGAGHKVLKLYAPLAHRISESIYPDFRLVLARIIGDYLFRCPNQYFATQLTGVGTPVYLYEFALPTRTPGFPCCDGLACHTSELPYVFNQNELIESDYSWQEGFTRYPQKKQQTFYRFSDNSKSIVPSIVGTDTVSAQVNADTVSPQVNADIKPQDAVENSAEDSSGDEGRIVGLSNHLHSSDDERLKMIDGGGSSSNLFPAGDEGTSAGTGASVESASDTDVREIHIPSKERSIEINHDVEEDEEDEGIYSLPDIFGAAASWFRERSDKKKLQKQDQQRRRLQVNHEQQEQEKQLLQHQHQHLPLQSEQSDIMQHDKVVTSSVIHGAHDAVIAENEVIRDSTCHGGDDFSSTSSSSAFAPEAEGSTTASKFTTTAPMPIESSSTTLYDATEPEVDANPSTTPRPDRSNRPGNAAPGMGSVPVSPARLRIDARVSRTIADFWVTFGKYGDPNGRPTFSSNAYAPGTRPPDTPWWPRLLGDLPSRKAVLEVQRAALSGMLHGGVQRPDRPYHHPYNRPLQEYMFISQPIGSSTGENNQEHTQILHHQQQQKEQQQRQLFSSGAQWEQQLQQQQGALEDELEGRHRSGTLSTRRAQDRRYSAELQDLMEMELDVAVSQYDFEDEFDYPERRDLFHERDSEDGFNWWDDYEAAKNGQFDERASATSEHKMGSDKTSKGTISENRVDDVMENISSDPRLLPRSQERSDRHNSYISIDAEGVNDNDAYDNDDNDASIDTDSDENEDSYEFDGHGNFGYGDEYEHYDGAEMGQLNQNDGGDGHNASPNRRYRQPRRSRAHNGLNGQEPKERHKRGTTARGLLHELSRLLDSQMHPDRGREEVGRRARGGKEGSKGRGKDAESSGSGGADDSFHRKGELAGGMGGSSSSSGFITQRYMHQMIFDDDTNVNIIENDCICNFWNLLEYRF